MLMRISFEEGYLVCAEQGSHARVRGGVFLPLAPPPSNLGSPKEGKAFLVVTFPPLRGLPLLRRPIEAVKGVLPRRIEGAASSSLRGPIPSRILLSVAAFLVLCAPPWVEALPPSYPDDPPARPFDLGRFEERVPIAEPFTTFAPLRVATFPSIGFFRSNPPPDADLAPWLYGDIAWAQALRRSLADKETWEKLPLERVGCGSLALYRLVGATLFRFAGSRDRQRLVWATRDPARICEAIAALGGGEP